MPKQIAANVGLKIEVSDTGYAEVVAARPHIGTDAGPGECVKSGHVIYVTVNSSIPQQLRCLTSSTKFASRNNGEINGDGLQTRYAGIRLW